MRFELLCVEREFLYLLHGCGLVGVYEVAEQFVNVLALAGHAPLEHVVGVGAVAEQLRYLTAQVY